MNRDEEYRRQAEDAENHARHATNDVDRAAWNRVAEGWLSLLRKRPQGGQETVKPRSNAKDKDQDDFGS
jgi:hypothetical protein